MLFFSLPFQHCMTVLFLTLITVSSFLSRKKTLNVCIIIISFHCLIPSNLLREIVIFYFRAGYFCYCSLYIFRLYNYDAFNFIIFYMKFFIYFHPVDNKISEITVYHSPNPTSSFYTSFCTLSFSLSLPLFQISYQRNVKLLSCCWPLNWWMLFTWSSEILLFVLFQTPGYSCRLLNQTMLLIIFNEDSLDVSSFLFVMSQDLCFYFIYFFSPYCNFVGQSGIVLWAFCSGQHKIKVSHQKK